MFIIEKLENKTIELDGLKKYSKEFDITSLDNKGKRQPFSIDLITSSDISVTTFGLASMRIEINVDGILNEEYVILKNFIGEKIIIKVKPNPYFLNEREYKFKISKAEVKDNGDLKLRILSKVNGTEIGWKCIYDGKPMVYDIKPRESNKSSYVIVKSLMRMSSNYISTLRFQQEESGEVVEIKIDNTLEGMKLAD